MIERRPFNQLGGEDHGWLKAEHHFSFADYLDATRMGRGLAARLERRGGSPYGATRIAGGDGSRLPTTNELEGARYQGRKIAEVANKLHG